MDVAHYVFIRGATHPAMEVFLSTTKEVASSFFEPLRTEFQLLNQPVVAVFHDFR